MTHIGVGRSYSMAQYLITVAFAHETVEIEHEGSLKDGLKAVWALWQSINQNHTIYDLPREQ